MPVHNALPYLDAAVASILDQSHADFEFVIYDDASTDGSAERLREWQRKDSRIRLESGERNLGPALSSNTVAALTSGDLIARMDADDISHPDRIRRQLAVMQARPEVGLIGTLCDIIDAEGRKLRGPEPWRLARKSWFAPFPHGSMMVRRSVFEQAGGYRAQCEYWEDQDLILRIARISGVAVIPDALYQHRQSQISTRVASDQQRVERAVDLMYRSIEALDRGGSYEPLLADRVQSGGRVDPRVFIALGSLGLWAGGKPHLFRRLLRRGRLGPGFRSASALVWTGWASLAPSSLRGFLSLLVSLRNGGVRPPTHEGDAVDWSPGRTPLHSTSSGAGPQ